MMVVMMSVFQIFLYIIRWPRPFLKWPNLKWHVGHMTHFDKFLDWTLHHVMHIWATSGECTIIMLNNAIIITADAWQWKIKTLTGRGRFRTSVAAFEGFLSNSFLLLWIIWPFRSLFLGLTFYDQIPNIFWRAGGRAGGRAGCLTHQLTYRSLWYPGWQPCCLTSWLSCWFVVWLADTMTDGQLTDWMIFWLAWQTVVVSIKLLGMGAGYFRDKHETFHQMITGVSL